MVIALPEPSPRDMGIGMFVGFSLVVNTWVALFCVVVQFVLQYFEMRRMDGEPGALSLVSLAMQSVVMLAVGWRWLLRLGKPTWEEGREKVKMTRWLWWELLREWYQWGFLAFNYLIHGTGCAILVGAYIVTGGEVVEAAR